jgi:hypothetical protein
MRLAFDRLGLLPKQHRGQKAAEKDGGPDSDPLQAWYGCILFLIRIHFPLRTCIQSADWPGSIGQKPCAEDLPGIAPRSKSLASYPTTA